jgi:PPK2 family polyphosphate:nucleotide phosphotransferase
MPSNALPGDLAAFAARLRIAPGSPVNLAEIDPDETPGFTGDRDSATAELEALRGELEEFQERLFAEKRQALLIVLQAVDAGGKDGVIRNVFTAFNPQGTRVTSFGAPTEEELAHDFLWRVHAEVPGRGRVGIFNRSHYEDVLVVRVEQLVPAETWRARYEHINDFEALLEASGTTILKFLLHVSRAEQRERLQERLDDPRKRWKFRRGDLEARAKWDDYQAAYADALERCSTAEAPWYVIPANRNWYRNLAVARIVVDAARRMNPQFPEPDEDLSGIMVPD